MLEPDYTSDEYLSEHVKKFAEFYESGVLKPETHHRMLGNIEEYSKQAGIQPMDVAKPFSETCGTKLELDYVLYCIRQEQGTFNGIYYSDHMSPPIMDRHKVFAGTIMRHFRKVKVLSQNLFFSMQHDGFDFTKYHTLCIPDLMTNIATLGDWHRRSISGLVMDRYLDGQQLILGRLASVHSIESVLGFEVVVIIKEHYVKVTSNAE